MALRFRKSKKQEQELITAFELGQQPHYIIYKARYNRQGNRLKQAGCLCGG